MAPLSRFSWTSAKPILGPGSMRSPLMEAAEVAQLFVDPGSAHLFADPGSGEHDPVAARLVLERTLAFLQRLDAATFAG